MGQGNPIPGLVLPSINPPLIQDPQVSKALQATQTWAKSVSPRMFAVGTAIYAPNGDPPTPPTDAYLGQRGIASVTISSGMGYLTLPEPFPNGWLSLQLTGGGNWAYDLFGVSLQRIQVLYSLNATVDCDFDAVGW